MAISLAIILRWHTILLLANDPMDLFDTSHNPSHFVPKKNLYFDKMLHNGYI